MQATLNYSACVRNYGNQWAVPDTCGDSRVFTVDGPEMGRDSALISAGVSVQLTPTLNIYGFYDGQVGRDNYLTNQVSCVLKLDF